MVLMLANTFGPHKTSRRWTWHRPDGKLQNSQPHQPPEQSHVEDPTQQTGMTLADLSAMRKQMREVTGSSNLQCADAG